MKIALAMVCLFFFSFAVYAAPKPDKKPVKKSPDLVVSKVSVSKPKKGSSKVTVFYTIKNQGMATSDASSAYIKVSDEADAINKPTPPLAPGQSVTTSWSYDVAKEGNYQIRVGADYMNKVQEKDERNNENTVRFSFGRSIFNNNNNNKNKNNGKDQKNN